MPSLKFICTARELTEYLPFCQRLECWLVGAFVREFVAVCLPGRHRDSVSRNVLRQQVGYKRTTLSDFVATLLYNVSSFMGYRFTC